MRVGVDGWQVSVFELAVWVGAVYAFPAPAVALGRLLVVSVQVAGLVVIALIAPLPTLDSHIPHQPLWCLGLFHDQQQRLLLILWPCVTAGAELILDL